MMRRGKEEGQTDSTGKKDNKQTVHGAHHCELEPADEGVRRVAIRGFEGSRIF